MSSGRRQVAESRGRLAESLAAWRLRFAGYRVRDRRVRTPFGEIDLIATRGDIAAFVEVKARRTLRAGVLAASPTQRRRIAAAANWLVGQRPALQRKRMRFDIVVVMPGRPPQHIPDAWRPDAA